LAQQYGVNDDRMLHQLVLQMAGDTHKLNQLSFYSAFYTDPVSSSNFRT
jgi:hypothetical protein